MSVDAITPATMRAYFPEGVLGASIYALPDDDLIYVRNPKVACSTIILWLNRIYDRNPEKDLDNVHRDNTLPKPREVGWSDISRMLGGEGFSFTFVRHPITRAASAYKDKILHSHSRFVRPLADTLGITPNPTSPLTVDQFVDALEQTPLDQLDIHFRPQYMNLMHGLVEFDYVGKIENFDEDLDFVRRRANLPDYPTKRKNASRRSSLDPFSGRPDIIQRLELFYQSDFDLYGYGTP